MKKLCIIVGLIGLFFSSCEKEDTENAHYRIRFNNDSDYWIGGLYDPYYPDTTINYPWFPTDSTKCKIQPKESLIITNGHFKSTFESFFSSTNDTLMFYIFDYKVLTTNKWAEVRDNYMVTQRYDLSLDDLRRLDWKLSFPPTEEMRNIKMWPPYGTYDGNGHRIKK